MGAAVISDKHIRVPTPQSQFKTDHFAERPRPCGISDSWVLWVLSHGGRFYHGGERVFFLGRKQLRRPQHLKGISVSDRKASQADGTVGVVGRDDGLITTYRKCSCIRHLKWCA
jgi:hypothetical protein